MVVSKDSMDDIRSKLIYNLQWVRLSESKVEARDSGNKAGSISDRTFHRMRVNGPFLLANK
jgi:hypothetical protein